MGGRKKKTLRLALLLFLCPLLSTPPRACAQASEVESIEIKSAWNGLGPFSESKLSVRQQDEKFFAGGKPISSALVENLLRELKAAADAPTLEAIGITEEWLQANAESALPKSLKESDQSEKNLFLDSFRNIGLIEKLLPAILGGGWTDDYPQFELRVRMKDGSTIRVGSSRQNALMVPLAIVESGSVGRLSYNAGLSRAIASLLPRKFTNRERLSGEGLPAVVARKVMGEIEEQLRLLETRNKLGAELGQLEGRYTLKKTAINGISSFDVGTLDYSTEKFPRWNAELHRNDLPPNVLIGVSLPYENHKLTNFDVFLGKIDAVVGLAMSVPWLSKYLAEHPETKMEIRFVTDRSMSQLAVHNFSQIMKDLGAEDFATRVQPLLAESAFLQFDEKGGWSRWVVLPGGEMVLFDFRGDKVLNWRQEDLTTHNRYDTKDWYATRLMISPSGDIELK
jgi:hypothetical protein